MKKTYIEPKNTVVALNIRENIMNPSDYRDDPAGKGTPTDITGGGDALAREVIEISAPDAWDEW